MSSRPVLERPPRIPPSKCLEPSNYSLDEGAGATRPHILSSRFAFSLIDEPACHGTVEPKVHC
jgi:hypothetical protein